MVDTGADAAHPDLADRLAPGWDFVEDDAFPQDANGHGTHVAGIIAAAENGAGIVGVAPAARIMPLRALDGAGQGTSADVAAAFAFAAEHGARVVNASLGSPYASLVERRAIHDHPQTLFVVAAGNGGPDGIGDDVDGAVKEYPCVHEEPNLVCVGATDHADAIAGFSNFGAAAVDLFAPGTAIVSTVPAGTPSFLDRYFATGKGYEVMQGTSMAAPHAAGVAALVAGAQPGWDGGSIRAVLLDGADRLGALAGRAVSGGRLNAAGAMALATGRNPGPGPAGPLGPELPELGGPVVPDAPPAGAPGAPPTLSGLRVAGHPRLCRGGVGCQARTAVLSFALAARAPVVAQLERRRCARTRCRWSVTGSRTRTVPAGVSRWPLGPRLLGMALASGTWRVTLATTAGRLRRTFTVDA